MSEKKDVFADDFEAVDEADVSEELAEVPESEFADSDTPEAEKQKKKTQMLADEKILDGTKEAYLGHIATILPLKLKMDPSKKYTPEEVWELASETDRQGINKVYRKPGKFGGGGADVVPKSKAHAKALELKKAIREAAYAYIQNNHADEFNELQGLVGVKENGKPVASISIEIYFKNDKAFVAALPLDE